ncbi:hypothetical protein [Caballeronia ptereochthonis]|uniref:Uncharacterized protein n=1 Tax=Caballeronia ptereochthonis TaxID=1777144 RepID=A0A158ABF0_9BURK|nr:hypothetical protein [Caballeronia ptereochthonis]SAK54926.1 hypothetical protein AWB83_01577 [Caballeronia ptereochthonis]
MNSIKIEIGQLEKTLSVLALRPRLIRFDYWVSQIERLLERSGLSAQDKQRLGTLHDLLAEAGGRANS